jgi:KTSC domain
MPSSVIRLFHYNRDTERLEIIFNSGRHYIYGGVPELLYQQMARAASKGEFFNAHIRNRFPFTRHPERQAS